MFGTPLLPTDWIIYSGGGVDWQTKKKHIMLLTTQHYCACMFLAIYVFFSCSRIPLYAPMLKIQAPVGCAIPVNISLSYEENGPLWQFHFTYSSCNPGDSMCFL